MLGVGPWAAGPEEEVQAGGDDPMQPEVDLRRPRAEDEDAEDNKDRSKRIRLEKLTTQNWDAKASSMTTPITLLANSLRRR